MCGDGVVSVAAAGPDVYVCVVVGEAVAVSTTANGSCSSHDWRLMGGTNHSPRHTDRDLSFISFNL